MIYTSTSISEVIGRIVRKTRVQDSNFLVSMDEWIPEAMGLMRTKYELKPAWKDILISFHMGKLPCGLINIKGVEWNGHRLKYNTGSRTFNAPAQQPFPGTETRRSGVTPFLTIPYARETPDGEGVIYDSTAIKLPYCISQDQYNCLPLCDQWYSTQLGYLQTSFADGCVRIHYDTVPLDTEGFPLIPDNEAYKEAIYWYVRAQMIGAGWEDKVFTYQQCEQRWELYASRAKGQISYPSVDAMEMRVNTFTRFIPPTDYFEKFYTTTEPEGYFGDPL